eukprot:s912_g26.t1
MLGALCCSLTSVQPAHVPNGGPGLRIPVPVLRSRISGGWGAYTRTLGKVIKGWTEAMQLMVEGDKWQMYIPSELGYGDGGTGAKIKGGDVLIFNMEIVNIKGDTKPADRCDVETLKGCSDKAKSYLEKQKAATAEKRKAELKRLEGMKGNDMKEDNKNWLMARINLLKKMSEKDEL